ncbi:tetratricopeptide repeat protein [Oceanobacter mangrovi]|uniref:tetratricopeptide repeat protein n=1 Tax=Oceanobacter mangrovi TaxID=2862510 RepID=UPI001C8D1D1C|nr:tetratricopeptide repeat protein [Oceanobacter mangrovi]
MMGGRLNQVILLALLSSIAQADIYAWKDEQGRTHYSDRAQEVSGQVRHEQLLSSQPEINQSLRSSQDVLPGISDKDYIRLGKLLRARQFDALNEYLEKTSQQAFELPAMQQQLWDAYQVFALGSTGHEHYFNDWVRNYPNQEYPYLARAVYQISLATASSTSIARAREYYLASFTDIDAAIRINPASGMANALLLTASHTISDQQQYQQYLTEALRRTPGSLLVMRTALEYESPLWGGSDARMQALGRSILATPGNANMGSVIQAARYYLMARSQQHAGQKGAAIRSLDQALKYQQTADYYALRGQLCLQQNDYTLAMADFSAAVQLRSADSASYLGRAQIFAESHQYRNAAAELAQAARLTPDSPALLKYREQLLQTLGGLAQRARDAGKLDESIDYLDKALMMDEKSGVMLYQRSLSWLQLGKQAEAEQDLQKAVQRPEAQLTWFQQLDTLYSRRQRWDRVDALWSDYLQRFGDQPEALLGRADARYQNDDFNGALDDANKAVALDSSGVARQLISKAELQMKSRSD